MRTLAFVVGLATLLWTHFSGAGMYEAQVISRNEVGALSEPSNLPDGKEFLLALYRLPKNEAVFVGALVTIPGSNGFVVLPSFAHWFAETETASVERSLSLAGIIEAHGGRSKFELRLVEYASEQYLDQNGYNADPRNQAGERFTANDLAKDLLLWHLEPIPGYSNLSLFLPFRLK